jgi:hypothetical protein
VLQCLVRRRRKFNERRHDPVVFGVELATVAVRNRPNGPHRLAGDVKRDQQTFFGCRNDWHQIGVAPFEMCEQQRSILIEHVSAGPEIARRATSNSSTVSSPPYTVSTQFLNSVTRRSRTHTDEYLSRKKRERLGHEVRMELEHTAVPRIGIDDEVAIRNTPRQIAGVLGWHHAITLAVGDKHRLVNL